VAYYLEHRGGEDDFHGRPYPSVGARVVFDIDRLFAARDRYAELRGDRTVTGDEGLVVHEDPMAVLVVPDRLWRVDDLQGVVRPVTGRGWLRCRALTVREELPTWLVMGPHGEAVARVINQARSLTDQQARAIAAMDPADEERLVGVVWDRWHAAGGRSGSPVGRGLLEVNHAIEDSARRTSSLLFGWDDEDGREVVVDPAWQQAGHAANAAALAMGAPEMAGVEESQRMAQRWAAVVGPP
jgi:hypothetical protein